MESVNEQLVNLITKIMNLLHSTDEARWLDYFGRVVELLKERPNDHEVISALKKLFKSERGSFCELMLHKEGCLLTEENKLFKSLKASLCEICGI